MNIESIKYGAFRGGLFGLVSGIALGAIGYAISPPIDYTKIIIWENRFGDKCRFTYLDYVDVLKEDLLRFFHVRKCNEKAYNEGMRNIQSVIALYYPIKFEGAPAGMMDSNKATNFAKRASKSLEEILVSVDLTKHDEIEKAMMSIQLNLEEFIHFINTKSGEALPSVK